VGLDVLTAVYSIFAGLKIVVVAEQGWILILDIEMRGLEIELYFD
jgi:hypothetical protein